MDLVFIRVLIRSTPEKPMKYPDFGALDGDVRDNQNWAVFMDRWGGQHIDKKSKMKEADDVTPMGLQHCMYAVPAKFALAAVNMFPEEVSILSEVDAAAFYDDRAHAHEDENRMDENKINYIRAKYGVEGNIFSADTKDWDAEDLKALDPEDITPGIVKNVNKKFAGFKASKDINVLEAKDIVQTS